MEIKDIQQRKYEEVYADGYFLEGCTEFTPGLNTVEVSEPVHGQKDPLSGTNIENGTLTITLLERYSTSNILMDLICNYDPATTSIVREYKPSLAQRINIWSNIKNRAETEYISSKFLKNFIPPLAQISGEITARGRREFTGICDIIKEFSAPIFAEKIAVQRIQSPAEDVGDGDSTTGSDGTSAFDMKYSLVNDSTLVVKVDGVTKTKGTDYNFSPRTGTGGVDQIIFTSGNHPLTGEAITAEYTRNIRLSNRCLEIPPDTDLYALAVIALNQESPVWEWVGQGDTSTTTFDLDNTDVSSSSLVVYLDGTATTAYTFSNGTGGGGVDQIIFDTAPGEKVAITVAYTRSTEGNSKEDLSILETMVNSNQAITSSVNNTTTFDCDIPNADRYKYAVGDEFVIWDVSAETWLYRTGTTGCTIAAISAADGGDQGAGYTKIIATTGHVFGTGTPANDDILFLYDDAVDQIEDGIVNTKAIQDQTTMGVNMTHAYIIYLGHKDDISVYPNEEPDGIRGVI